MRNSHSQLSITSSSSKHLFNPNSKLKKLITGYLANKQHYSNKNICNSISISNMNNRSSNDSMKMINKPHKPMPHLFQLKRKSPNKISHTLQPSLRHYNPIKTFGLPRESYIDKSSLLRYQSFVRNRGNYIRLDPLSPYKWIKTQRDNQRMLLKYYMHTGEEFELNKVYTPSGINNGLMNEVVRCFNTSYVNFKLPSTINQGSYCKLQKQKRIGK